MAPRGEDRQQAVLSYFKESDPEKWRTGCPTYARIVYEDLWPGIDLVFRGTANRLKHEFLVEPGAEPGRIRLALRGASEVRLDDECDLVVGTPLGAFEDARPVAYQVRDGRRVAVEAAFDLDVGGPSDDARYGFALGKFDPSLPLVLDPEIIVYSGFLGGSNEDGGAGIAVDGFGAAYVTGRTKSADFPAIGGLDPSYNGASDAFVAKVDAAGNALVYSGFLGGSDYDVAGGIAVDAGGAAYVTGYTLSSDFPTVGGLGPSFKGGWDAFVAKVAAAGDALIYSGFLGGSHEEQGLAIAAAASGAAYVTGYTLSSDFPTLGALDPSFNGGVYDAFVATVDPAGNALV